jgi:hypothetical protein
VLVIAAHPTGTPARIDLCQQRSLANEDPQRLLPVLVGYRLEDALRLASANQAQGRAAHFGLRKPVIVSPDVDMPRFSVTGRAIPGEALQVTLGSYGKEMAWISDLSGGRPGQSSGEGGVNTFQNVFWVLWGGSQPGSFTRGVRVARQNTPDCPAGSLEVSLLEGATQGREARLPVEVFPLSGETRRVTLTAGDHVVPRQVPALEDRALFQAALDHGLIRLDTNGAVRVAPKTLALQASPVATDLGTPAWPKPTDEIRTILERLYHKADGDYVRRQVALFNNDRWLCALRERSTTLGLAQAGAWLVSQAGFSLPVKIGRAHV